MKTLLLGANGLLGHNVLEILLQRKMEVRILVRDEAFARQYEGRCEVCCGSFLDASVLRDAVRGCDAIINCAGTTDMSLSHYRDFLPVNKAGVELILQTMEEMNVGNLVHVSTANTVGYGSPERKGSERDEMQSPFSRSLYAQSKYEAEQMIAWYAIEHKEKRYIVLNPTFMLGAFDAKPSSGQLLLAAYQRKMMVAPKGGKNFIAVQDAAVAVVNALTMGTSGERYLISNVDMSIADFFRLQSEVCGYQQKIVLLPDWFMKLLGLIGDGLIKLGVRTQLSTRNVRQLLVKEYYDNSKARQELQLPNTPIEQAVKEFFAWREKMNKGNF